MNSKTTKYAFLVGVVYFTCMSIAHFFGIKVPLLFVYYDTPFYAYQDKIISFAVCAYIGLFLVASRDRFAALVAIIVLALTALGLSFVNFSNSLNEVLQEGQSTLPYWLQTAFIAIYTLLLIVLFMRDKKNA
ncbi:MAG: hypothetical protein MI748_01555 [Opitutales bacterium]|nr:hypothetical protein [Opitutales bacterium]